MWEPRVPLVAAEKVVDFNRVNAHIDERRQTLEHALAKPARDLADSLVFFVVPSQVAGEEMHKRLYIGLTATYLFGFRQARHEITRLRQTRTVMADYPPRRASEISRYLGTFVASVMHKFIDDVIKYRATLDDNDPLLQAQVRDRTARFAHNLVLEVVGQTLNAGRTFAALGEDEPIIASRPPAKWAMRSEQLDANTCAPCDDLHGAVAQVGSVEYFELLPPTGCLGRGRCRGLMVYADDPADFLTL